MSADELILDYTQNYMEKVFYFCLKKTGAEDSAGELTQEISLAVIAGLRRGACPESFPAWVWQIAKNRYARFAGLQARRAALEAAPEALEALTDGATPEEELIHSEDIALLRRELAFISGEYRGVLVAYYIRDKSVTQIARELSLPLGTVKAKLFRARKILKEGMNMAREFGKLSYSPENIGFNMSGWDGSKGEPWSIVNHRLYQNILLAAYRTPSTAEELAMELGIALPYMEDELEFLVESTLLKKMGNRYETALIIVSGAAQKKMLKYMQDITPALTKAAITAVEYKVNTLNSHTKPWHAKTQSSVDMRWNLLMQFICKIADDFTVVSDWTNRPNGGKWDLVCYEKFSADMPVFVGHHVVKHFKQFKFCYENIHTQTPDFLTETQADALEAAVKGFPADSARMAELVNFGYFEKTETGYKPKFAVYYGYNPTHFTDAEKEEYNRLTDLATEFTKEYYSFCRELITADVPDFMKDSHQIDFACEAVAGQFIRGYVFEEALKEGYLTYSGGETEARDRCLGAYIYI